MATAAGVQSSNRGQSNGVLQITAAQTAGTSAKSPASKASGPRLKILIRRLPPGLTQVEFAKFLGEEWSLGRGRVDWLSYKPGKDSKEYVAKLKCVYFTKLILQSF